MDLDISFESEEEEMTAAEVFQTLEEIWINEKFAPELLPHKNDIVECMYLQIQTMEKNISNLEKHNFIRRAHEMELIRIRYMLASYLRTRLLKIEMCTPYILKQETERESRGLELYLTENEKEFAQNYNSSIDNYLKNATKFIAGHIPEEYKDQPIQPLMSSYVFLQSKKTVEGVIVDEVDDLVDIRTNSKMIMPYNSIVNLLKNGDVKLI